MKTKSEILMRGVAFAVLVAVLSTGCGGQLNNATVEGTVKFQERPITGGQVSMFCAEKGIGATASLGPNGVFKIEGPVRAGNYVVTILPPPGPPPLPTGSAPPQQTASYVPEKYRNEKTSDLKVDVVPGENHFDLILRP